MFSLYCCFFRKYKTLINNERPISAINTLQFPLIGSLSSLFRCFVIACGVKLTTFDSLKQSLERKKCCNPLYSYKYVFSE